MLNNWNKGDEETFFEKGKKKERKKKGEREREIEGKKRARI